MAIEGSAVPARDDRSPTPRRDCELCGRSWARHALYYLPASGQFFGWRSCESIDDIETRWWAQ